MDDKNYGLLEKILRTNGRKSWNRTRKQLTRRITNPSKYLSARGELIDKKNNRKPSRFSTYLKSFYWGNQLPSTQIEKEKRDGLEEGVLTKNSSLYCYPSTAAFEYGIPYLATYFGTSNSFDEKAVSSLFWLGAAVSATRLGFYFKGKIEKIPFVEKTRSYLERKLNEKKENSESKFFNNTIYPSAKKLIKPGLRRSPGIGIVAGSLILLHYSGRWIKNLYKKGEENKLNQKL